MTAVNRTKITMNPIQTPPNAQINNHITHWAALLVLLVALSVGLTVGFISRAAQTDKTATPGSARYQISAFGNTTGHGAYVLDTWTGEVWLVGQFPQKKIADKLN